MFMYVIYIKYMYKYIEYMYKKHLRILQSSICDLFFIDHNSFIVGPYISIRNITKYVYKIER